MYFFSSSNCLLLHFFYIMISLFLIFVVVVIVLPSFLLLWCRSSLMIKLFPTYSISIRVIVKTNSFSRFLAKILAYTTSCVTLQVVMFCCWKFPEGNIPRWPKNGNRIIIRTGQSAMCGGWSHGPSSLLLDPAKESLSGKYDLLHWDSYNESSFIYPFLGQDEHECLGGTW